MQTPKFPTIPVPDGSVDGLQQAMVAVIQIIHQITGMSAKNRAGETAGRHMTRTFIQDDAPDAFNKGDLWLCTVVPTSFNVWDGNQWIKIAMIPPS